MIEGITNKAFHDLVSHLTKMSRIPKCAEGSTLPSFDNLNVRSRNISDKTDRRKPSCWLRCGEQGHGKDSSELVERLLSSIPRPYSYGLTVPLYEALARSMPAFFPKNACTSLLELHFPELHRGGGAVPPSIARNCRRHRQVPATVRPLLCFLLTNCYI